MGAFYVDQKKKDLPPSTLPSEHKQWVFCPSVKQTGMEQTMYFPIAFPNAVLTAVDSVDTPNAFYRTSSLTKNSLVFAVTNTGYVTTTCRAVIIGY
mgnify:CR=1 FL=1